MPLKGSRLCCVSETSHDDILSCGVMKKLTGGDGLYARGLFKDPIKINPFFKLILHCNKMPMVSAEDKASWNRIRVLIFESIFVEKSLAPNTKEEQYKQKVFPMDKTLKDKLPELAEPFLWWLIKNYEEFGDKELFEPEEVKFSTSEYHKSNDFYIQFCDERIISTGDTKDYITLDTIYTLFKIWYKNSYPNRQIPTRPNVAESIEKKLGKPQKGVWRGVATFDPSEDYTHKESEKRAGGKGSKKLSNQTEEIIEDDEPQIEE